MTNNWLPPPVQHRFQQLQKHNNQYNALQWTHKSFMIYNLKRDRRKSRSNKSIAKINNRKYRLRIE